MSLAGKLVSEIEINVAAEKYYKVFKDQPFNVPNISPKLVQQVELDEGDWDNHGHGSVKTWKYTVDGKPEVFKEKAEFDDEKFTIIMNGLQGDVFEHYKTFKIIYQAVPKGPEHSLVVLSVEYEKLDDEIPYPYKYLHAMACVTKDIEPYLKK
ncbi:MLP-like protein 328 [Cucurbita pepo subsp. pepo]|uniref:MLP-like protein 328 n=1 Tax=Cucurbita pepo subsp. pepo TaxID=3664 RepID=UPI000C9D3FD2|nr:MLP-like protein 328 [Cucurbita pepo subsp. pepo]